MTTAVREHDHEPGNGDIFSCPGCMDRSNTYAEPLTDVYEHYRSSAVADLAQYREELEWVRDAIAGDEANLKRMRRGLEAAEWNCEVFAEALADAEYRERLNLPPSAPARTVSRLSARLAEYEADAALYGHCVELIGVKISADSRHAAGLERKIKGLTSLLGS